MKTFKKGLICFPQVTLQQIEMKTL